MDDKTKLDLLRMATDLTVASLQANKIGVSAPHSNTNKGTEAILNEWIEVVYGQFQSLDSK